MDVQLYSTGGMSDLNEPIIIRTRVLATPEQVWACWTEPAHITAWNQASPDWHCPHATNNVTEGGRFAWHMAARDGSVGFDFGGMYTLVVPKKEIRYRMDDGRRVAITFERDGDDVVVTEAFEAESLNARELQQAGWQAILESFRQHVESLAE